MALATQRYQIIESTKDEIDWVESQINNYNRELLDFPGEPETLMNYYIKDNDEVIAGINSCFYFGEFLWINVLFVKEQYRGKGIGKLLLSKVEDIAKAKGAKLSHLHAFEFDNVKEFYLRLGYEIYGVMDDCPAKFKHYFFKKHLN
ncbi:MAG: GNAT family N-acetyltransferase [Proteobacteria bacterium]|nr:GNAT family N-acetyltransferase [Pseudomonadota bacterium]